MKNEIKEKITHFGLLDFIGKNLDEIILNVTEIKHKYDFSSYHKVSYDINRAA